ncbi:hypothetical protein [Actinomadura oligospora]|uniref:hypothetical protein n=1 Tax=Actinomadura oligospora TaxID=111804 RepID=UPI0004B5816D|nr:hypothetical protein [Actinomadura oligospora]
MGVPPLAPSAPPPPVPPRPSGDVPHIPRRDVPDGRLPSPVERLRTRFPGVHFWWGVFTFSWWAYVPAPGLGRLIEAPTPDALAHRLTHLHTRSGL